jgi:D-alanyl-D-alanine carboxypeptidase
MKKCVKKIVVSLIIILLINIPKCGIYITLADDNIGQPIGTEINKDPNVNNNSNNSNSSNSSNSSNNNNSNISNSNSSSSNISSVLILVNKNKKLSSSYIPSGLRTVKARCTPRILYEQKLMQNDAAKALEQMFKTADKSKIYLYCVSGYRSYKTQKNVYSYKTKSLGAKMVSQYVAYPGNSEHQTGLAMDITNKRGINKSLSENFAKTAEGKWLMNNAYKYGFVIRYPSGKEKITGYSYEPWHVRYVGLEAAKKMTGEKIVLEEYLDKLNKQNVAAAVK